MSNPGFRGYRTISQHLNDLKKENFSLKLRIYFLEEKIQQKFEESSDDVHKRVSDLIHLLTNDTSRKKSQKPCYLHALDAYLWSFAP